MGSDGRWLGATVQPEKEEGCCWVFIEKIAKSVHITEPPVLMDHLHRWFSYANRLCKGLLTQTIFL
jgi:hypothetical protein